MAANKLTDYLIGRKAQGFEQHPYYSIEGDFVTFYFRDEDFYASRIDDVLTIYHSMDNHDFVGFKLKSVTHLLRELGDFGLHVTDADGKIMLGLLFLAGMKLTDNFPAMLEYQQLSERTKDIPLKLRELQPV
jgi:hypothetical protein